MRFIIILILILSSASGWSLGGWAKQKAYDSVVRILGFPTTSDCGFTRKDALVCIKKYVDRNQDGEISQDEFEYAKQHFVPERVQRLNHLLKRIHWDYTLDNIKPKCDANMDGHFTMDDWMASAKTCLPHKADLCKLQYICQIAAATQEKK